MLSTTGTVYNNNVTLRPEEALALPGEKADKHAMGLLLGLDASYEVWQGETERVRALFSVVESRYDDLHEFSTTDLSVGLQWARVARDWRVIVTPTAAHTFVHDKGYR